MEHISNENTDISDNTNHDDYSNSSHTPTTDLIVNVVTEFNISDPYSSDENQVECAFSNYQNVCAATSQVGSAENSNNNEVEQIESQAEKGSLKDTPCLDLQNVSAMTVESDTNTEQISNDAVYDSNISCTTLESIVSSENTGQQLHANDIPPNLGTLNPDHHDQFSMQFAEETNAKMYVIVDTEITEHKIKAPYNYENTENYVKHMISTDEEAQEPPVKRPKVDSDISVTASQSPEEIAAAASHDRQALSSQFTSEPRQISGAWKCFENDKINNYLRGCKWAPDGTCLVVNSNDNTLRVLNLPQELYYDGGENKVIPELMPVLSIKESDTVYDFAWFPLMSSAEPETACLAVTSKDTPIHLYDAFTGMLRCSYRAYNHLDEVVAAHCVEFSTDGLKLYSGFNKMIRVFDVTRPGREFMNRPTFAKDGQRGIISCISPSPTEPGLYAAGSYAKSVALYHEPMGEMVCMFEGQQGGVTQVKFSPDGTKLYSGGRKDNEILCWDMRNPGQILFTLNRLVATNQRVYFDITSNSRYVISGSHDGNVIVWDALASPVIDAIHSDPVIYPAMKFQAHFDTVNGVSVHKTLPLVATTSGQRHFKCIFEDSDDDDSGRSNNARGDIAAHDNCLRLWWT